MHQIVTATYQDGLLRPSHKLPYADQQQVLVILVPLFEPSAAAAANLDRVTAMQVQARAWLSQQNSNAVRPPLQLTSHQEGILEDDFDAALAVIRQPSSKLRRDDIAADIETALVEERAFSAEEQARLEAELEDILAEWDGHAT